MLRQAPRRWKAGLRHPSRHLCMDNPASRPTYPPSSLSLYRMTRRIAVIGAGPSGLSAAKHLLANSLTPVVFDSRPTVGGFWSLSPSPSQPSGVSHPTLRTNLSRWTCSFSDFFWDAVDGDDGEVFPDAKGVGRYLEAFRDRFLRDGVEWRLGTRVNHVEKEDDGWIVEDENGKEKFDGCVFGGGFFASQNIPGIDGMENFTGRRVHTDNWEELVLDTGKEESSNRTVLVVGGSLSSVEVLSEIAARKHSWKLIHVAPYPFYTLPKFLPVDGKQDAPTQFLPLDLILYDIARAKDSGLSNEEALRLKHAFLSRMAGGKEGLPEELLHGEEDLKRAPWVTISDWYTTLVKKGRIQTRRGQLVKMEGNTAIIENQGKISKVDCITDIVFATGYTPAPAFSRLLPASLLSSLSFDATDAFLPILLHRHQFHSSLGRNAGFVGFYKGPYFGIIEEQARKLARVIAGVEPFPSDADAEEDIAQMRVIREQRKKGLREQWPHGNYTAYMQKNCKRTTPLSPGQLIDPLIPASFSENPTAEGTQHCLLSLSKALSDPAAFLAPTIFRSLHGEWKVNRELVSANEHQFSGKFDGTATFTPRPFTGHVGAFCPAPTNTAAPAPSTPATSTSSAQDAPFYPIELVYFENGTFNTTTHNPPLSFPAYKYYLYRLTPGSPTLSQFFLSPSTPSSSPTTAPPTSHFHDLEFYRRDNDAPHMWRARGRHWCSPDWYVGDYEFWFGEGERRGEVRRWCQRWKVDGPKKDYWSEAWFERA